MVNQLSTQSASSTDKDSSSAASPAKTVASAYSASESQNIPQQQQRQYHQAPVHADPHASPAPSFTVSHANRPASLRRVTTDVSLDDDDDAAHTAWLEGQKVHVAASRRAALVAFMERHEQTAVAAVPIAARLKSLLGEAHRYERALVTQRPIDSSNSRHYAEMVDTGYRNLLVDVQQRCRFIESSNTEPQQQFQIGSEAIAYFSSMLPWSDGIVSVSHVAPAAPYPVAAHPGVQQRPGVPRPIRHSARGRQATQLGVQQSVHTGGLHYGGSAPGPAPVLAQCGVAPGVKFSVPQRLALDQRKLAATTAARRRRLLSPQTRATPAPITVVPAVPALAVEMSAMA